MIGSIEWTLVRNTTMLKSFLKRRHVNEGPAAAEYPCFVSVAIASDETPTCEYMYREDLETLTKKLNG